MYNFYKIIKLSLLGKKFETCKIYTFIEVTAMHVWDNQYIYIMLCIVKFSTQENVCIKFLHFSRDELIFLT